MGVPHRRREGSSTITATCTPASTAGSSAEYCSKSCGRRSPELPVDGITSYGGLSDPRLLRLYHGICHCDNCRRMFRARYGMELPKREDMQIPRTAVISN
jgi:hypothetical protein